MVSAVVDWFSEWPNAGLHYDERPTPAVWLITGVLACAGAAVVVVDPNGVSRAIVSPVGMAPVLVTVVLLCWWTFSESAGHLAALVAALLVASAGAAALLAPSLYADPDGSRRWLMAFGILNLLLGAYLHGRAWALILWYAKLNAVVRTREARLAAVLSEPGNGKDFVAVVVSIHGDRVRLELRDGDGARTAFTAPGALKQKPYERGRYLVTGAQLAEEQVADEASGYRQNRVELRVLAVEECEFAGFLAHGVSFAGEVSVAVAMLVLQHVVLGLAAALLGPHI